MDKQDHFFVRAERLLERLETLFPPESAHIAWEQSPRLPLAPAP